MPRLMKCRWMLAAIGCLSLLAPSAGAQTVSQLVGLDDLIARLGKGNQPIGAGVIVGQVEASEGASYGPDQGNAQFAGKTFIPHSGDPGASSHATGVGLNYYGNPTSIAPQIGTIHLYEANSWVSSGYLRTGSGATLPLNTPVGLKIFNNSWIGDATTFNNEILRRADFVVNRDQVLIVSGMPNGPGTNTALMHHMFNGISVGLMSGTHGTGPTMSNIDGPGRMKPEIVAPDNTTSGATPIVSAALALLVQTANTDPMLSSNPNALRSETLRAVLLAGANHRQGWTNNPFTSGPLRGIAVQPLDSIYGADLVNINNSHMILTGQEQNAASTPPTGPNIQHAGWDLVSIASGASVYYRFNLPQTAEKVLILATWNRIVQNNLTSWSVAQVDMMLWRVGPGNQLLSLIGDDGLPYFAGGNVAGQSLVDTIEHLYITDLEPGQYVLEVNRVDANGGMHDIAVAWLMPEPTQVPGDVTGDGQVNVADLLATINMWGTCPPGNCPADLNHDGVVNVQDLLLVITNWG